MCHIFARLASNSKYCYFYLSTHTHTHFWILVSYSFISLYSFKYIFFLYLCGQLSVAQTAHVKNKTHFHSQDDDFHIIIWLSKIIIITTISQHLILEIMTHREVACTVCFVWEVHQTQYLGYLVLKSYKSGISLWNVNHSHYPSSYYPNISLYN